MITNTIAAAAEFPKEYNNREESIHVRIPNMMHEKRDPKHVWFLNKEYEKMLKKFNPSILN